MKYLFLENKNGKVIRTFFCDEIPFFAVKRIETGRFELWTDETLKANKDIPVQVLSFIPKVIPEKGLPLPQIGTLKQGKDPKQLQYDIKTILQDSSLQDSSFHMWICFFVFFMVCFVGLVLQIPLDIQQIENEFQVDIIQPEIESKTLIIKNPSNKIEDNKNKVIDVKKSNRSSSGKSNAFLAIKSNTQKLKLNLGGVFSLDNKASDGSKKSQSEINQELYDKSIFSASATSNKLEGIGDYVKATKDNQGSGHVALLNRNTFSKSNQVGSRGLSIEQQEALDAFISKEEGVLRLCYEKNLQIFPEFKGDIYLSWRVDQKGKTQNVRVAKLEMNKNSNTDLDEFKKCIIDRIKLWSFPLILKGEVIPYTFQFNRPST